MMKALILFLIPALLAVTVYGFIPADWHSWMLLYFLYATFQVLAVAVLIIYDIGKGDFPPEEVKDPDQTERLEVLGIELEVVEEEVDLERTWRMPVLS